MIVGGTWEIDRHISAKAQENFPREVFLECSLVERKWIHEHQLDSVYQELGCGHKGVIEGRLYLRSSAYRRWEVPCLGVP